MQRLKSAKDWFLGFLEGGVEEDPEPYDHLYEPYGTGGGYYDDDGYTEEVELASARKERNRKDGNVLDFNANRDAHDTRTQVILTRPKEMQDATFVCDHLRANKICVVNLQGVERTVAQRIADYLGGVSYALNGHVERVDSFIFIMAPETASITSDLVSELKGSSRLFGRS